MYNVFGTTKVNDERSIRRQKRRLLTMKRIIALVMAAAMIFAFAACGEKDIADTPLPDEPPEPVAEQLATDD